MRLLSGGGLGYIDCGTTRMPMCIITTKPSIKVSQLCNKQGTSCGNIAECLRVWRLRSLPLPTHRCRRMSMYFRQEALRTRTRTRKKKKRFLRKQKKQHPNKHGENSVDTVGPAKGPRLLAGKHPQHQLLVSTLWPGARSLEYTAPGPLLANRYTVFPLVVARVVVTIAVNLLLVTNTQNLSSCSCCKHFCASHWYLGATRWTV